VRLLNEFDHLGADSLHTINELNDVLAFASLCGLGQMAPNPVRALMKHFPDEVDEHVRGLCSKGVCTPSNGVA
jgi:NADH:ubiquinone oxidoreductase subunit F (NADH-binding)